MSAKNLELLKAEPPAVSLLQRPKIQLGISTRKPKLPSDIEDMLIKEFGDIGSCACCGVTLLSSARKSLPYEGRWYSVCPLCFFTENLDLIPMFEKGTILLQPFMSQVNIFTMMRAHLASGLMMSVSRDPSPDLRDEMVDNDQTIKSLIEKLSRNSGKVDAGNSDTVDSYIHLMDILKDDEYEKRFMSIFDMRWIPDVKMMGLDAKSIQLQQFDVLHPEKLDSFTKGFVLKYQLPFEID